MPGLVSRGNIHQHLLGNPFSNWPRALFLFYAPLKVLWQVFQLMWVLLTGFPAPRAILVQNPPSIPTLMIVWLVCLLRGSQMVVDWHNFGYTILGLSLGPRHLLVWISRIYEGLFAKRANAHLCVTGAMREWLKKEWGVTANLLYDRPPPFFKRLSLVERHELFFRLAPHLPSPPKQSTVQSPKIAPRKRGASRGHGKASRLDSPSPSSTLVTTLCPSTGQVLPRPSRPAVLVSSTSWTADEDFGMLLDALSCLDAAISLPSRAPRFPDFLVLVTGKGPLRSAFESRAASLPLRRIAIRTLWLTPEDYPRLLGAADCGVSLHSSSSGLDLPMKVVDMFGAGLPVCALNFPCLHELVKHGKNGLIFNCGMELASQLERLFEDFLAEPPSQAVKGELAKMRRYVELAGEQERWEENWEKNAAPLFNGDT